MFCKTDMRSRERGGKKHILVNILKESNAILLSKSEEMVPFGMVKVVYSLYCTSKAKN